MELLKRVSLYKSQKNPRNWKFEALATQMTLIGFLLVILVGSEIISTIDPNAAFMVSTVHSDAKICVNMTCGGLYCLFTQPVGCDAAVRYLKLGETDNFCNPREGCNWDVEIVNNANYDNRSSSLFIVSDSGRTSYFPPLELLKRQFVDITKYESRQGDLLVVDWAISEDTRSTSMSSCGNSHPALLNENDRCGSYNFYLANTVYTTEARQKYRLELSLAMFWTLTSLFVIYGIYYVLCMLYGDMLNSKKQLSAKNSD